MRLLFRPAESRLIGGVCAGIAERFEINVWMVRMVVVTGLITSPLLLLFYLLFWLSLPGEIGSVSYLQLSDPEPHGTARFNELTRVLLLRTGLKGETSNKPAQALAFVLLALAFALQMPKVEGQNFYYLHPLLAAIFTVVTRFAAVLFYASLAIAFLVRYRNSGTSVDLRLPAADNVALDAGPFREIGGLLSGVARVTRLQPVIIRVLFVFLNIMTFGIAGLIYLFLVWLLRREGRGRTLEDIEMPPQSTGRDRDLFPTGVRIVLAALFLILAVTRLVTEVRLFFFNEPFFQGVVLTVAGAIGAWAALRHTTLKSRENLWLIAGCAVMLTGIYELTTTLFRVQLSLGDRFIVAYLALGLAFLYYAIVSLRSNSQRVALGLAALLFLAAAFVEFNVAPSRFLLALVEFYDFFYPILFAGFGLWLVMEG